MHSANRIIDGATLRSGVGYRARVLVVDDDADAAANVKEILEAEGHLLGIANDGQSALQAAAMMNPEIALVDLRLRGEWGLDVVAALRARHPDLVCVIQTGESDSSTVISALRQGVYDYLTKPLDPDQLITVVHRAAEKAALQDDRRLMMDALQRAKERAELASRTKTEFLARISDELGRQFERLTEFAAAIAEETGVAAAGERESTENARNVVEGCRRLLAVMSSIGELGRLEAGTAEAVPVQFEIEGAVRQAVADFQPEITRKGLTIDLSFSPSLPPARTDQGHFRSILRHLLSNAIKFSRNGGSIEVQVSIDHAADLKIRIIDNGVGMDPAKFSIALAPFGRVGNAAVVDPYGAGLGLPLAERLTAFLGGRLGIASKPDAGTIVELKFSRDRVFALGKGHANM